MLSNLFFLLIYFLQIQELNLDSYLNVVELDGEPLNLENLKKNIEKILTETVTELSNTKDVE